MTTFTLRSEQNKNPEALLLPLFQENFSSTARQPFRGLSPLQEQNLRQALASGHIPKAGVFPIFSNTGLLLVMALGEQKKCAAREAREAGEGVFALGKKYRLATLTILPGGLEKKLWTAFQEGVALGSYEFTDWHGTKKKAEAKEPKLEKIQFLTTKDAAAEKRLAIMNAALKLAKDIINEPPYTATPTYLENVAKNFAKKLPKVTLTILKEKELEKLGCGGLIAVGRGSDEESRLILLEYRGGKKEAPLALVGKGVTYDTGGLSIKPSPHMATMKQDLGGAATVLGAFWAIAEAGVKKNVLAVIPTTENLVNHNAYKPDDILRMYNGVSVEVTNTDAEGRLILADALAYVEKKFAPRAMVDLATLTGACMYAVGNDFSAFLSTDEKLSAALKKAAAEVDEPIWELPLHERYNKLLESPVADIVNSSHKLKAGTIEGALFLKHFVTDKTPWCHMDIASVAFDDSKGLATGRNVRLLWRFVELF